nr:retrovirus-related Pol polyprotein from transposon 17.6 [Tanacetum cinerariifolium]
MVNEGIVLGHKVSGSGIEVDKAKIEAISKLPYPTNVKAIRSFLEHVGFYRRFIKDISQVARPMTQLFVKDAPFNFSEECIKAFYKLKPELTLAHIMIKPDWSFPFEIMCDVSDYVVRALLGQRKDNVRTKSYEDASLAARQPKSFNNVTADHEGDIMGSPQLQGKSSKLGKLKSRWYGPFSVSKDIKNGATKLYNENGNEFIVNKQRVKPYQNDMKIVDKDDDITLADEGEVM